MKQSSRLKISLLGLLTVAAAAQVVLFTNCSSSKSPAAASVSNRAPTWETEHAVHTPGPSTEYGNFGKAITTDNAGYVDVVWMQGGTTPNDGTIVTSGTASIHFSQSADHGATWDETALTSITANTSLPRITSSGADIYVVWPSENLATNSLQVYLLHGVRSGNQVHWASSPTMISNSPMGANAIFPVAAANGNEIHVAWSDTRSAGISEVYYSGSLDKGATWSTPTVMTPVDGYNSWTPSIAAHAGHVYLAWTDARFGQTDCTTNEAHCAEVIYYRGSANSGQTWGSEVELTCDTSLFTFAPSVFAEGDDVHIAYFQGNPTPPGRMNLYYIKGSHAGASLAACSGTAGTLSPLAIEYPNGDNITTAWRPSISVHDGVVHMVWWSEFTNTYNTGVGQSKVYYSNSSDGVTWSTAVALTPQTSGSIYRSFTPNISVSDDGTRINTIWLDHRNDGNALTPNYQVFFRSAIY